MSVSDPLLKDVKASVHHFLTNPTPITDNTIHFLHFAQLLETIFNKGLIRTQNTKFLNRTIDVFSWICSLKNEVTNLTLRTSIDQVRERRNVETNDGRFRLFVKVCLVKKCLHSIVEHLMQSQHCNVFYTSHSILGDEILMEIFLSVLRQVSKLSFKLDLDNASFLDKTWLVPVTIKVELVPCDSLGIAVSFADNRAVIVRLENDGVAAENENIKVGDVLDKLNDTFIRNSSKGRLKLFLKKNSPKPISLQIIKGYDSETGEIYPPLEAIFKEIRIDLNTICKKFNTVPAKGNLVYGYPVKYLAKVDVGTLGNVCQVQKALRALMGNQSYENFNVDKYDNMALLEIGEIGLKIRDKDNLDLILDHPYMKISSCGNIAVMPKVFGYCAGEETCDVAHTFSCFIFEAISLDDADLILQSIGQGFLRTHYAV